MNSKSYLAENIRIGNLILSEGTFQVNKLSCVDNHPRFSDLQTPLVRHTFRFGWQDHLVETRDTEWPHWRRSDSCFAPGNILPRKVSHESGGLFCFCAFLPGFFNVRKNLATWVLRYWKQDFKSIWGISFQVGDVRVTFEYAGLCAGNTEEPGPPDEVAQQHVYFLFLPEIQLIKQGNVASFFLSILSGTTGNFVLQVSVIAKQHGTKLVAYETGAGDHLEMLYMGSHTPEVPPAFLSLPVKNENLSQDELYFCLWLKKQNVLWERCFVNWNRMHLDFGAMAALQSDELQSDDRNSLFLETHMYIKKKKVVQGIPQGEVCQTFISVAANFRQGDGAEHHAYLGITVRRLASHVRGIHLFDEVPHFIG